MTPSRRDPAARAWLEQVLAAVEGRDHVVLLTHDNPDPDAMASAAGVAEVLARTTDLAVTVAYGGIIGRAENRALVRHAELRLTPVSRLAWGARDAVGLIDTQPEARNHSLPQGWVPAFAVDHHRHPRDEGLDVLRIVSADHGATSSIVTRMLRAAGVEPSPALATALFYGVKTDTQSLGRESSPEDEEAYAWLFQLADKELLSRIEYPQVPAAYFAAYHKAFERAWVYGRLVFCDMGEVYLPDIVPEVAERLLLLEGTKWSACVGIHDGSAYVSLRTSDRRMNAGKQLRGLVEALGGSAGGHGMMAGGRLPASAAALSGLRDALVHELHGAEGPGVPLVGG